MRTGFDAWASTNRARIIEALFRYIAIDTVSPHEEHAFDFLSSYLEGAGFDVWREALHPATFDHPDRCPAPLSKIAAGQSNLRGRIGPPDAPAVLVSSHIDVVPLGPSWTDGFTPRLEGNAVVGRGACDTKGNLIMFVEAVRYLQDGGARLHRRIEWDGVIEEEIGGNGALSAVLHGRPPVEGVLVLEPTSLHCFRGHRGCLGLSVVLESGGGHMGAADSAFGPIQMASVLVGALSELEIELNREARDEAAFDQWPRPIQINVGRIEGGQWHGSSADRCTIMVNMGFPTNYDLDGARRRIEALVTAQCTGRTSFELRFDGISNDAYLTSPDAPFVRDFVDAMLDAGVNPGPIGAWKVSCDARLYARHLGVPTLVFGAGELRHAHADHERLDINQLFDGMYALTRYFARP